jgi:Protein of unknown function (DUF3352)
MLSMGKRLAAAAALTVLAFAGAGCGGGSKSGAGSLGAATIVPASAPVYFSIDTSLSSDQWKSLDSLLGKFPGKDKLLTQLRQSLESDTKVSWKTDIKPALGPELDVAVLDLEAGTDVVGFLQPKDEDAFNRFVQKTNAEAKKPTDKVYVLDYKGWKVVADSRAKLDRFKQDAASGGTLADDATFKDATGALSDQALVKVFANGPQVADRLRQVYPQLASVTGTTRLDWASAELVSKDDGLALNGNLETTGSKSKAKPYEAKLLGEVPSGALLYASFRGNGQTQAQLQKALRSGTGTLPPQALPLLRLLQRLAPLFANENALYVRTGTAAFIPEVTLVTQPKSTSQGVARVDKLVAALGSNLGVPLHPRPVTVTGARFKELNLGNVSLYYGAIGGKVVLTDSQRGVSDLQGGGSKLKDDSTFKDAKKAAGLPDSTNGFVYVDLKDAIPLLEGLVQLGGAQAPSEVSDNLRPLQSFTAWSTRDGDATKFTLFLEIK